MAATLPSSASAGAPLTLLLPCSSSLSRSSASAPAADENGKDFPSLGNPSSQVTHSHHISVPVSSYSFVPTLPDSHSLTRKRSANSAFSTILPDDANKKSHPNNSPLSVTASAAASAAAATDYSSQNANSNSNFNTSHSLALALALALSHAQQHHSQSHSHSHSHSIPIPILPAANSLVSRSSSGSELKFRPLKLVTGLGIGQQNQQTQSQSHSHHHLQNSALHQSTYPLQLHSLSHLHHLPPLNSSPLRINQFPSNSPSASAVQLNFSFPLPNGAGFSSLPLPLSQPISRSTSASHSAGFPMAEINQSNPEFNFAASARQSHQFSSAAAVPTFSLTAHDNPAAASRSPAFSSSAAAVSEDSQFSQLANPSNPGKLLMHVDKQPLAIIPIHIQSQYTMSKKEAEKLSSAEREKIVFTRLRIMGNAHSEPLFIVAKDICMMIHVRKGNVAKTISQFSENEKYRMAVVCNRSNGISSTQILTVLAESGVERLLSASKSPLAPIVREFYRKQIQKIRGNSIDPAMSNSIDAVKPWNPDAAAADMETGKSLAEIIHQQAIDESPREQLFTRSAELISELQAQRARAVQQFSILQSLTETIKRNSNNSQFINSLLLAMQIKSNKLS